MDCICAFPPIEQEALDGWGTQSFIPGVGEDGGGLIQKGSSSAAWDQWMLPGIKRQVGPGLATRDLG